MMEPLIKVSQLSTTVAPIASSALDNIVLYSFYKLTSSPYLSFIPSNHCADASDESAKMSEHIGSPFSFKNLLTLIVLLPPSGRGRSDVTNVIFVI